MLPEIIKQWDANKHKLEEYFRTTPRGQYNGSYHSILRKVIELAVTTENEYNKWDADKITVVDDGDYQGTQLFLIPSETYQPSVSNYLFTHTYYGSCSGCDTLEAINDYGSGDELATEEQVKDYMTLALHLVQRMKNLGDD
jgi:hypothetical protein